MRPLDHLTQHSFYPRPHRRACRGQQLHRASQRLHAALGVRRPVSRPIAKRGASGAGADCDLGTPRPGEPESATSTSASAGSCCSVRVSRRTCRARVSGDYPTCRDSSARRAGSASCCTRSIRAPSRRRPCRDADRRQTSSVAGRIVGVSPEPGSSDGRRCAAGRSGSGTRAAPGLARSRFVLRADVHRAARRTMAAFIPFRSRRAGATRRCVRDPGTGRRCRANCERRRPASTRRRCCRRVPCAAARSSSRGSA